MNGEGVLYFVVHIVYNQTSTVSQFTNSITAVSRARGGCLHITRPAQFQVVRPRAVCTNIVLDDVLKHGTDIETTRKVWTRMCVIYLRMVRFQVLTATSIKMAVFWVVAPCSLVDIDRRFSGAYCLHHEGDD
jgi:hypothetical protein